MRRQVAPSHPPQGAHTTVSTMLNRLPVRLASRALIKNAASAKSTIFMDIASFTAPVVGFCVILVRILIPVCMSIPQVNVQMLVGAPRPTPPRYAALPHTQHMPVVTLDRVETRPFQAPQSHQKYHGIKVQDSSSISPILICSATGARGYVGSAQAEKKSSQG